VSKTKSVTVRFQKPVVIQKIENANIARISGFMTLASLIRIVREVGLAADPRLAKESRITKEIMDTLANTPSLYPFKSKGILVGVSDCKEMDRERFELTFDDDALDVVGILDGGHNVFAIIKYLLGQMDGEPIAEKKWDNGLEKLFHSKYTDLIEYLQENSDEPDSIANIKVTVEILMPIDNRNERATFNDTLAEICAARNTNAQLKEESVEDKEGLYDFIKNEVLDPAIKGRIIWKTGEEGEVNSSDLLALSWIVLGDFDSTAEKVSLPSIYSSKAKCISTLNSLLKKPEYSEKDAGKITITDERLKSALKLLREIPYVFDRVYIEFGKKYNREDGSFGRIQCVKCKPSKSKFYGWENPDYNYPDGFIVPLVCGGLSALVKKDDNGMYSWKTDPKKFFDEHLDDLMKIYAGLVRFANWNPQNLGKNNASYDTVAQIVKSMV
jgi:hypothetical protein